MLTLCKHPDAILQPFRSLFEEVCLYISSHGFHIKTHYLTLLFASGFILNTMYLFFRCIIIEKGLIVPSLEKLKNIPVIPMAYIHSQLVNVSLKQDITFGYSDNSFVVYICAYLGSVDCF